MLGRLKHVTRDVRVGASEIQRFDGQPQREREDQDAE
jgi:hypothetical protein